MLYYLYLKTHNVTGLKYLGQTCQDPFKYHGSGKKWTEHLQLFGKDVTTQIIYQSTDIKEIADVGRYYSSVWNIVESKEWANLIPESCSGHGNFGKLSDEARQRLSERMRGDSNISKTADFREKHSRDNHWTKRIEHQGKEHVMKRAEVREKISGPRCYRYDHTQYTFFNQELQLTVTATKHEFQKTYGLDQSCISRLVAGKFKQYKGWALVVSG
jgi:hypothetical protein